MNRTPIRESVKCTIAAALGCCLGASVEITCDWCSTVGTLSWFPRGRRASFIRLDGFEWDHHTPVAAGGHSGIGNVWPICIGCNRRKGAKHPHQFERVMYPELFA